MNGERYEVRFQPAARRAIAERLPESVAAAVLEFCDAALALSPRRVGKPLFGPLAGCHGARRGTYRVVYRIDEQALVVEVLDIDHRADIYHRSLTAPRPVDEVIGCLPWLARRPNADKHVGTGSREASFGGSPLGRDLGRRGKQCGGECRVGRWAEVIALAAGNVHTAANTGRSHTVGLRSDDTVLTAGRGSEGQCDVQSWREMVAVSIG